MIIKWLLSFLLLALSINAFSQSSHWTVTGMPCSAREVRCIYNDTLNDALYVSGTILATGSSSLVNERICKYSNTGWTIVPGVIGGQVFSMVNYNGDLVAAGPFYSINGDSIFSIAKYDGTSWQPFGSFDVEVTKLRVIGTDLYAMGYFNSVNGIPAKRIAKWNGSTWSDVYGFSADTMDGHITDVTIYNGNTYVCGNFSNSALGINHMAVYRNGSWQNVGGGIHGSWNDLAKMLVYKNELYLFGLIIKPDNTGNGIQKWNDTVWSEVGSGIQGFSDEDGDPGTATLDAVIHNNELYVVGCFGYASHVPAFSAAKWNGTRWCGLYTTGLLSNKVNAAGFYKDTLYMGLANDTLNGVYTNRVIKYLSGESTDTCSVDYFAGITDLESGRQQLFVYPNPSKDQITIRFTQTGKAMITICNIFGQTLQTINLQPNQQQLQIDTGDLPSGIYFIRLHTNDKLITTKFIRE